MSGYYLYFLGDDGRIQSRIEIICGSDVEARAKARQLADGYSAELWQQARKVESYFPCRNVAA